LNPSNPLGERQVYCLPGQRVSHKSQRHYTVDDYFTVEEMSEVRHEYFNGEIFAMAGASLQHNEIAANVLSEFRAALRDTNCGVYGSDLRILTPTGLYTYPDISVICGQVQLEPNRPDTAVNPVIIVEVLSQATEEYDRGDKFTLYKSIPNFQHYILISQSAILVDHFVRIHQGEWQHHSIRNRNDILQISEPPLAVNVSDIFRRVFK
jgi:Uma2 family endonuclease